MEMMKICPDDLRAKFHSKQELYDILSIDLLYHLPPIEKCPISFLKEVLSGEKKVLKQSKVTEISVPRYKELSVHIIWPLIKESEDLVKYFPNYAENQLPDRRSEEIKNIIKNARKNRAVQNENNDDELVFITKTIYDEISGVLTQNLKKGKAANLLKRSSKLNNKRKKPKEYELNYSNFDENEERKHDED